MVKLSVHELCHAFKFRHSHLRQTDLTLRHSTKTNLIFKSKDTMNILIVHAHPEPLSFTTSLKTTAQQTFKKLGHQVEISDLYAMQFNPVASKEDF